MNTYIKQLIDSYGNNLIPISGTSSCYNSKGQTVEEIMEIQPITWTELRELKLNKKLASGTVYCITDYKATSTQLGTTTTDPGIKILVQAISKNALSEDAVGVIDKSVNISFDPNNGTITVKKLILGDDYNDPGTYEIDEEQGGEYYLFHDMFEFNGTTYYRWMRYVVSPSSGRTCPLAIDNGDELSVRSRPNFLLTLTDTFDFSDGQYYEPDFSISYDNDTEDIVNYIHKSKVIMGVEEITVPLILFFDKFRSKEDRNLHLPENLIGVGDYYVYSGTIELDGTTYYKWDKFESGSNYTQNNDAHFMISNTLNYTFSDTTYYKPYGFMTVDNESSSYEFDDDIHLLDSNYKEAFQNRLEFFEIKYSLENDINKFLWIKPKDIYYYIDVTDYYSLLYKREVLMNGSTYYFWSNEFIQNEQQKDTAGVLTTSITPKIGDNAILISDYNDPTNTVLGNNVISNYRSVSPEYNKILKIELPVDSVEFLCISVGFSSYTKLYLWYNQFLLKKYQIPYFGTTTKNPTSSDILYIQHQTNEVEQVNAFKIDDLLELELDEQRGTGVIYNMKDSRNNEAPYDFKSIIFSGHYTFDCSGSDYSNSTHCCENIISPCYDPNGKLMLNNVRFLNTSILDICKANYIGPDTHDTSYGPGTSNLDTRLILGEY